ncbi:hypothetical protein DL770_008540 [Monosporascus sp. CRB-9-2]|nr:hypothetical protein DL770_008540 [Monosporascus sp. CRB-9-2]
MSRQELLDPVPSAPALGTVFPNSGRIHQRVIANPASYGGLLSLQKKQDKCVYENQGSSSREVDFDPSQPIDSLLKSSAKAGLSASGLTPDQPAAPPGGESMGTSESVLSWRRQSSEHTGSFAASPQSHNSTCNVQALLSRIRHLESRLEKFESARTTGHDIVQQLQGKPEKDQRHPADGTYQLGADVHIMSQAVMNKTRYFGPSHWANAVVLCRPFFGVLEQLLHSRNTEIMRLLQHTKTLGRAIKNHRTPELNFDFGADIPPREVADSIVAAYLGSLESVYRILHVPSFRREYDDYWASPGSAEPAFVIQLQLVMAIGSALYDDNFSMRLGGDLVWIQMGSLLRTAFYIGLHRDPDKLPGMTQLKAEMRRRLWSTILELDLQSSIDSGSPPMIPLDQGDIGTAANSDDEHLVDAEGRPVSQSPEAFTDMSVALILRESFLIRLTIAKFLNNVQFKGSYRETLRLHAYKSASRCLQGFGLGNRAPSLFQRRMLDAIFSRYFIALHVPFFAAALTEPAYAFSRKTGVEMALKTYYAARPRAAPVQISPGFPMSPSECSFSGADHYARLSITGGGFFRYITHLATIVVALELHSQLQEDIAIGLPSARPDLIKVLQDAKLWSLQRVEAGDTNAKGYIITVALCAKVDSLLQSVRKDECERHLVDAALEAGRRCVEILERSAGDISAEAYPNDEDQLGPGAAEEEWDAMQGIFYDFTNIDSVLGFDTGSEQVPDPF